MNPARRLAAIRQTMVSESVDALLVATPANVAYLTGFESVFDEEPSAVCVIAQSAARVYVDARYDEGTRAAAEGGAWSVVGPESDVWERALGDLAPDGASTVALEASVSHKRYMKVAAVRGGELREADAWVEQIRIVKEDEEIERIASAAALADAAFDHVLGIIAPGVTEIDIALDLELFMRRHGSEGVAFPSIVASGPNGSRPHAKVTGRALERGDLVTMDFGARIGGYCSDMTRTVGVGEIDAERRRIYETVRAANEAGLAAVRGGLAGTEIDAAARCVIDAAGFGDRFGHGLGHGVGLEVHEAPSVGPRGVKPVPANSVITVEPGVYVPGVGGARIEDLVVVGEEGPTVLSHSPKDLIEL